MKRYTVRKWFKYSEDVDVYAESAREAEDKACHETGDRNYDDYIDSCEVIEESEEQ